MDYKFALVAGNGPFKTFELATGKRPAMKVVWTYDDYNDYPLAVDQVRYLKGKPGFGYNEPEGLYYIGSGDFGGGNLLVFSDDEGDAAMIAWSDDGTSHSGYYRAA